MLNPIWKGLQMAFIIARHFFHGIYAQTFFSDETERREFLVRLSSRSARDAIRALGLKIQVKNPAGIDPSAARYLIVSNHLSYLDVLVISSWLPSAFVTSMEVRQTPFLGKICLYAGSLFVERRQATSVRRDLKDLSRNLKSGINVAVFPEATSTNGAQVLPFKRGLLAAAQLSGVNILPVCINYTHIDGKRVDLNNRDVAFYYGEMNFFPHLMRLLRAKSVNVELKILNEVPAYHPDPAYEPTEVAFQRVQGAYLPVM